MTMRLRDNRSVVLSSVSQQILGPNPRRKAVVITAPPAVQNDETDVLLLSPGTDNTTLGVKLAYTVPAGVQAMLETFSYINLTGTIGTSQLQVVRSGVTTVLRSNAGSLMSSKTSMPLQAGDTIQFFQTVAGTGTTEFMLGLTQDAASQRITISFGKPAALDQGINIQPGNLPLELDSGIYGDALAEPIFAIAAGGTPTIGVMDVFGP